VKSRQTNSRAVHDVTITFRLIFTG